MNFHCILLKLKAKQLNCDVWIINFGLIGFCIAYTLLVKCKCSKITRCEAFIMNLQREKKKELSTIMDLEGRWFFRILNWWCERLVRIFILAIGFFFCDNTPVGMNKCKLKISVFRLCIIFVGCIDDDGDDTIAYIIMIVLHSHKCVSFR